MIQMTLEEKLRWGITEEDAREYGYTGRYA